MAEKLDPKEIVTLEDLAIFNTEVKYMKTHRPLPFGAKDSERKKELEKETYRLAQATLQYFEEQCLTPEEAETYLQEVEQKVRKLKRARGQRKKGTS